MILRDKILRYEAKMEEWIEWETRKRKTEWWGAVVEIEPVICSKVFGDGKQLVYLGTIDQRPHYWLIRIDSSLDVGSDDFDWEENLLMPLEEEFGRHPYCLVDEEEFCKFKSEKKYGYECLEDYETFEEYNSACQYPAIWWGGGHWGSLVNFGTNNPTHKKPVSPSQETDV